MSAPIDLARLNAASTDEFVSVLGGVFEHSPWVAQRSAALRPFASVDALHAAMCAAVARATDDERIALIRAHPQLAGKAAIRGELTAASAQEQSGAGLHLCSPDEFARVTQLNAAYQARFGFPFILAVRGHTRTSIIDAMARRLDNARDDEIAEAVRQIERIAAFRLADLITAEATR